MLLSIIIPVYNVKNFLDHCIISVLSQRNKINTEIILIDDGSTDGSSDICNEYTCQQHVTVIHQKNGGLSAARNSGLKVAKGEYVYFLDSDDYIIDGALPKLLKILKSCPFDLVCYDALIDGKKLINISNSFAGDSGKNFVIFFQRKPHILFSRSLALLLPPRIPNRTQFNFS